VCPPVARVVPVFILVLTITGCRESPPKAPAIGEAYVGPVTLKIRSDIPLQSATVATVKHGDRLEILQHRRRFFRVRAPGGAEGWTDERQLLSADDMTYLRDLAKRASKMPVQGRASTFGELNVHTQPSRSSPSFLQIKEKEKVDVLTHLVTPRTDLPQKPLLPPPPPKKPKSASKKPGREPKYPPPPMPKPPRPPANWMELSKTDMPEDSEPVEDETPAEKPMPTDDWSLVRNAAGQSGWVLTRRLVMSIPDEVAQYAEGRRIVSYFSLAKVQDGDQTKDVWLWTTVTDGTHPYDFESFRVFIWSLRHHRYETAYIERNLQGYAPVLLQDVDYAAATSKGAASTAKYPGFSICSRRKDGELSRRDFALLGNVVRYAGEAPCQVPPPFETPSLRASLPGPDASPEPAKQAKESLWQRIKKRLHPGAH